jgi:acetyl esterase/lipase
MKTASIVLLAMIALISFAKGQNDNKGKYDIEVISNLQYTEGDYKPQTMDIIKPKGQLEKPMPVIVWIHGGAWAGGDKSSGIYRSKPFAEKGYFCATITYRLSPDSSFPAHIEDCKCAIRFLRANAKKFNLDPERIGVWGDSAGGHLSALLGTSGGAKNLEGNRGWAKFSSNVQAVCDFFGPSDITKMGHKEQIINSFLGGPLKDNFNKAREASPLSYVSREDPPFLIIHGDKDQTVPIEQSEILTKALQNARVPVELIVLKGAGHGGTDFMKSEVVQKTMDFFDMNFGMDNRNIAQTGTVTPISGIATTPKTDFVMKTFVYKQVGNLKVQADVYRANDAMHRPVLVWLHGGGLITGGRQAILPDIRELCRSQGYVLVSADYRLAPEAKLPQIIEDLQDLIIWVNDKGPVLFRADPKNIVVAGQSAGGYLTMMSGICRVRPKALVSYWGYGDVDGAWYSQPSLHYRSSVPLVSKEDALKGISPTVLTETQGGNEMQKARQQLYLYLRQNGLWTQVVTGFDPKTEKKKLDPYCPVRNITANYPPILMIHGTNDQDVPCQESLDMAEQLKQKGVRYELIAVPGAGHMLSGGDKEQVAKAHARAREFIKENLGSKHVSESK